jgi:hypothetical protein
MLIFIITPNVKSFALIAEELLAYKEFSPHPTLSLPATENPLQLFQMAGESCRNESLRAISSQFLAKCSLSPKGEFID